MKSIMNNGSQMHIVTEGKRVMIEPGLNQFEDGDWEAIKKALGPVGVKKHMSDTKRLVEMKPQRRVPAPPPPSSDPDTDTETSGGDDQA